MEQFVLPKASISHVLISAGPLSGQKVRACSWGIISPKKTNWTGPTYINHVVIAKPSQTLSQRCSEQDHISQSVNPQRDQKRCQSVGGLDKTIINHKRQDGNGMSSIFHPTLNILLKISTQIVSSSLRIEKGTRIHISFRSETRDSSCRCCVWLTIWTCIPSKMVAEGHFVDGQKGPTYH